MRISASGITQTFYDWFGDPIEICPRFCVNENLVRVSGSSAMANGISILEQMKRKPDSHICFLRTSALGDILILTPVINWLKEEYPACRITLATSTKYLGLFKYWDLMETVDSRYVLHRDYDVGYYLGGILEQDHRGGPESYKHRLDIYCDFLEIPVPKDPVFSLPYSDKEKLWAEGLMGELRRRGKPVIVMQAFGSTGVKRFSPERTQRISAELSKAYIIIMAHDGREDAGRDVVNVTGKTDVHELCALIDCADAVVTMDSGILWVAHCTQTPVIALLGPTREAERLTYHRNYHVVNLAEMVGCEPCFERLTGCKGSIDCMNRSDERAIVDEIEKGVLRLVSA